MNVGDSHDETQGDRPQRAQRRPRYSGTHPRRFEQRYKELDPEAFPEMREHVLAQGRTPAGTHVPVLVDEVLAWLRPQPGEIVVDCTLGYGGHARELLDRIAPHGRLIGLDHDARQLQRTAERLGPVAVTLHRSHFGGIAKILAKEGLDACDVILADLGPSSMQLDDPARGFSYKYDGPLDMRMDDRVSVTAADYLAKLTEEELSAVLLDLADEPDHRRIAREIVRRRAVQAITTTRQLTRLIAAVKEGSPGPHGRKSGAAERKDRTAGQQRHPAASAERHPAARTFQALRMLVNDEVGGLEQFLRVAPYCLRPGGRLGIITFHSGEHHRVETALGEGRLAGMYSEVTDPPVKPKPQEVHDNPRSRSARLYGAVRSEV
jgi:16S rRNA (cytosine1402-N4)-methyltransferase